jgi:hypothetical protein
MLQVKNNIDMKLLEKYGFKKIKGAGKLDIYYMCISCGIEFIFISPVHFDIIKWEDNDSRIHKKANVPYGYESDITALDIVCKLIKDGILYTKYFKETAE